MRSHPINPQQILNTAMQLMHSGRFSEALPLFLQLERIGIKDPRLYRSIGAAFERLNDKLSALKYFKLSLLEQSAQADLHFAVANLELAMSGEHAAIPSYREAVKLAPDNAIYWLKLGVCLTLANKYADAMTALNKSLQLQPRNTNTMVAISRVWQNSNENALATNYLRDCLDKLPDDLIISRELAWTYKNQGQYDQALPLFERVFQHLKESSPDACEDLALILLDLGDADGSLEILQQGIKIHPLHSNLANLHSSLTFELKQGDHLSHYKSIAPEKMPDTFFADYIRGLIKNNEEDRVKHELNRISAQRDKKNLFEELQLALWEKQKRHDLIVERLQKMKREQATLNLTNSQTLVTGLLALGEGNKAIEIIKPMLLQHPKEQYFWALYTTALRQVNSPLYDFFCDYDALVFQQQLILSADQGSVDNFNQTLKSVLTELHITKQNPLGQSLVSGTQTPGNLLTKDHPVILQLRQALLNTSQNALKHLPKLTDHPVTRFSADNVQFSASWSVKLKNQGYHVPHIHTKGWYSSAYYVDIPDEINNESKQGWLHLGQPGMFLQKPFDAERWIKPEPGTLVLFPSFFWHGTQAFNSDKYRMSVAFDLVNE